MKINKQKVKQTLNLSSGALIWAACQISPLKSTKAINCKRKRGNEKLI